MDVFNISVDDLEQPESKSGSYANEFKPNPKQSTDNVYRALIRPIYWLDDTKTNYIPKSTFYFGREDGNDSNNPFFDSPYSIKEDCLAMNTFFDLKRESKKDARAEQLADAIRPKSSFFYLVLVESDGVHPENEGKVMVYKAPIQVHRIIQKAVFPSEEDKKFGTKAHNIFDPFKGKSLKLAIDINAGNWNYNGTVTFAEAGPVKWNGGELTVEDKDDFMKLLEEGNELMKPYKYTKMTDDRYNTLLSIISAKTGKQFGDISPASTSEIDIEGMEETNDEPEADDTPNILAEIQEEQEKEVPAKKAEKEVPAKKAEKKAPAKKETKVEAKAETGSTDDEAFIDDLIDGLDV